MSGRSNVLSLRVSIKKLRFHCIMKSCWKPAIGNKMMSCKVIQKSSLLTKLDFLMCLATEKECLYGFDTAVDYERENIADVIQAKIAGLGVDLIINPLGQSFADRDNDMLAFNGDSVCTGASPMQMRWINYFHVAWEVI